MSVKRKIGEMYFKRVLEVNDLEELKKEALSSNFNDYFINIIDEYKARSKDIVNDLGLNDLQNKKLLNIVFSDESF